MYECKIANAANECNIENAAHVRYKTLSALFSSCSPLLPQEQPFLVHFCADDISSGIYG